jgi:hypothetical protein
MADTLGHDPWFPECDRCSREIEDLLFQWFRQDELSWMSGALQERRTGWFIPPSIPPR